MQLMCPTMQLIFTIKSMKTLGIDVRAEDTIDIDGYKGEGYGVSAQHELSG